MDTVFGLSSRGPFNITLWNVTAEGTVFLVVNPDGTIRANRSISDMTYEYLTVSVTPYFCNVINSCLQLVSSHT